MFPGVCCFLVANAKHAACVCISGFSACGALDWLLKPIKSPLDILFEDMQFENIPMCFWCKFVIREG